MMIDNEIVKLLENCPDHTKCDKCALDGQFGCISLLHEKALGLINRQKAEIERLKKAGENG